MLASTHLHRATDAEFGTRKATGMPLVSRRRLAAATIVLGVVVASLSYATAQAATVTANLAVPATQNVIVLLRNQHTDLAITKGRLSARVQANRQDQSSLISAARSHGARNLRGFDSINGFAATATPSVLQQIAADPNVAAIVPDRPIRKPDVAAPAVGGPAKPATVAN